MVSPSSSSTNNAVSSARHENFMFMDQTSVVQGWRTLVAKVLAKEKQHIVCALGETNASKFNKVGFCLKRPVQILSPFAVPPGPLRRAWINQFLEVRAKEWRARNVCRNHGLDGNLRQNFSHFFLLST